MRNSPIFETESLDLSPPESGGKACHCAKCLASHARKRAVENEAWEEFDFEEAFNGAAPRPRPVASRVAGRARARAVRTAGAPPTARSVRRASVAGFARYRNDLASLPPAERLRIDRLARFVVETHVKGSHPINTIRVVGHADFDTPRRPAFEMSVSDQRAHTVLLALQAAVARYGTKLTASRAPLSRRIKWQRLAVGATMPVVTKPVNETERLRNRHVDILIESERSLAPPKKALVRISKHEQGLVPPIVQLITACTAPSPRQTASVSPGPDTSFTVGISTLAFNPSTIGFIQQVVPAGSKTVTSMRFSCHRVIAQARGCFDVIPAWRFGADL